MRCGQLGRPLNINVVFIQNYPARNLHYFFLLIERTFNIQFVDRIRKYFYSDFNTYASLHGTCLFFCILFSIHCISFSLLLLHALRPHFRVLSQSSRQSYSSYFIETGNSYLICHTGFVCLCVCLYMRALKYAKFSSMEKCHCQSLCKNETCNE